MTMACNPPDALPPSAAGHSFRKLRSRIRRHLRHSADGRPWSRTLEVRIAEGGPRCRPTAWILSDCAVNAVWAASVLDTACRFAVNEPAEVDRILITSPADDRTGHAPAFLWQAGKSPDPHYPHTAAALDELQSSLLRFAAAAEPPPGGPVSGAGILRRISRSPAIQHEAILQLLRRAKANGCLRGGLPEARALVTCAGAANRWQAISLLQEQGMLAPNMTAARPLRPIGTAAIPGEILRLVAAAFGRSEGALQGHRRTAALVHPRHFAAAVIRRATSRSLTETGTLLGGRDHSTVMAGLERIDRLSERDPIHGDLLDLFSQVADNLGILKQREFRLMAASEIAAGGQPTTDRLPVPVTACP